MATESFLKAREKGRPAQTILANYLRRLGMGVEEVPDGFFQAYDLKTSTGKTVEVKSDQKSHLTSNIYLELEALDHSEADILAISYGVPIKCFYLLPMDKAREFAHSWPNKVRGGEFMEDAALVKRSLFLEILKPEIIEV